MPGNPPTRFVYLGPEGTFAEQALRTVPAAEHGTSYARPQRARGARRRCAPVRRTPRWCRWRTPIGGAVGVTLDELANGRARW